MSSSMKIIASALLVAVAAADCDGLDTGRFCVAGNSTAFVYCPQDIELVCGATTFCKQTQDADISCNVPKYCPSLATEAGSYCMEDDETSFYTCPESPIVGQEATKCGKGLKCHQKTATTTECIPADTCADKKGGYFCSYEDPNKYYSCPGFATQACPRGLVCTAPSAGQIACDYPKSEVHAYGARSPQQPRLADFPKNCQEPGSMTSCKDIDANAYCGDSEVTGAMFGDGTGCSCKWGFTFNHETGVCEGSAPPAIGANYCGADWQDASTCMMECDADLQCPGGFKCFASIECPAPSMKSLSQGRVGSDFPKNCQEAGSMTSCKTMDANAYCGTSEVAEAVFTDGSGCSCKWGFAYNAETGACEGSAPAGGNFCGSDWKDATSCAQECDADLQCPGDLKCFASIEC